jgi:hypothetical protein
VRRPTGAAARRSAVLALVAGVVAFGGCFAAARALTGDDHPKAAAIKRMPDPVVTVSNLERAGTIKPLRSVAGAPPAPNPPTAAGTP